MSSKLSGLTATTSVVDADLLYTAKSPFGSSDSKKITLANFKTSIFNSPCFITGDAGTYDKYLFVKTSPAVVNQGGIILSNVDATTAGYNGFKMTSTFNSLTASSVFSMGFVELNATETFTSNSSGFLNFYNNSGSGYMYARVPLFSSSSMSSIYNTISIGSNTTLTSITQALGVAGNLITSPYQNNGYTAGLFFANTDDNATKPKWGIWGRMTGSGTSIFMGTSSDYATGITNSLEINPTGKIIMNASTTAGASLNVPSGTAPSSPVNGDMWFDGTNFKAQVGGATKTFTII